LMGPGTVSSSDPAVIVVLVRDSDEHAME
jgi:hypothetical protein